MRQRTHAGRHRDLPNQPREPGAIDGDGQPPARRQLAADAAVAAAVVCKDRRAEDGGVDLRGHCRWPRTGSRLAAWRRWPPPRARPSTRLHLDQTHHRRRLAQPYVAVDDAGPAAGHRGARDDCRHHAWPMFTSIGTGSNVFRAHRQGDDRVLPAERRAGVGGSRWPAAPHQGGCQSQGRQHPRAPRVHVAQGRAPRPPRPHSAWPASSAAPAGNGVAGQGRHLQPAHAWRVHRQGRRHDRVRPQCHRSGGRHGGLRRAHRQRQGRRDVAHDQQGGAGANRRARSTAGDDDHRSAAGQIHAAPRRARCQRPRGQRRAPARRRPDDGRRHGSRRPAPGAGQCRHRRRGAPRRRHDD